MPIIDIAVPCYNYARYLPDCLMSILAQDLRDLRVLVIDNASTDGSLEIARAIAARDPRVEIKALPVNVGPNGSYNAGVDWAQSPYFLLLDADDMLTPGCLSRAVSFMEAHPEVVMTHGAEARLLSDGIVRMVDEPRLGEGWRTEPGHDFIRRLCQVPVNHVGAPTVIRRTKGQKLAGHYRVALPFTDDLELWLRLAAFGNVAETGAVQAVRRIHTSQMSGQFSAAEVQMRDFTEREAAMDSFFANEGAALPDANRLLHRARRRLGQQAYWSAISHACRGHLATSRKLLGYALSRNPAAALVPPVSWLFRMRNPLQRAVDVLSEFRLRRSAAA
jgi:hypothetical protein